jgi:hypothetical protein
LLEVFKLKNRWPQSPYYGVPTGGKAEGQGEQLVGEGYDFLTSLKLSELLLPLRYALLDYFWEGLDKNSARLFGFAPKTQKREFYTNYLHTASWGVDEDIFVRCVKGLEDLSLDLVGGRRTLTSKRMNTRSWIFASISSAISISQRVRRFLFDPKLQLIFRRRRAASYGVQTSFRSFPYSVPRG